jgi:hypothetical protein
MTDTTWWKEIVAVAKPEDVFAGPGRLAEISEWIKPYALHPDDVQMLWVVKAGETYTLHATELLRRNGKAYLDRDSMEAATREVSVRIPANSWPEWMNADYSE